MSTRPGSDFCGGATHTKASSYFKMRFSRFFLLLPLFSILLTAPIVSAEDVSVTSTLNKRSVRVGQEVYLKIRIAGAQGNIQAPRLPSIKNLEAYYTGRASHMTFINGKSSSSVEFSYSLVPRQGGRYTVPPIEVIVNSNRYVTDASEIEVIDDGSAASSPFSPSRQTASNTNSQSSWTPPAAQPANSAPAQQQQPQQEEAPPSFKPEDDNIFIKAWVDKTSVYPNEQVLLTYSLYTRYDTRYEGFDEEPQVSGFWIEEFPMERDVRRETVRVNGKRYVKADVRKMALFPTAPADYRIEPGTMKASIRQEAQQSSVFDEFFDDSFFSGGSFFARRENRILKPPPIQMTVKPFPEEGKPAGFQGAVGNFRISASIDKNAVKQNDPVTMKLVIEGEGNIETLNKPPAPDLPGFKTYDSDASTQLFKTGNVIGGRKTFEVVYIPLEAGVKKIPALEFSFFNPIQARYVTIKTNEFTLNVAPSTETLKLPKSVSGQESLKKEVQVEEQDIRSIIEKIPAGEPGGLGARFLRPFILADIFLTLLIAFGLMREQQEKVFAKDISLKRRSSARSAAEKRMRKLKFDPSNSSAYFEGIEKIMTQYLSDKFNISAYGTTRYDLEAKLETSLGSEDPLVKEIHDLYMYCEEARFAKAAVPEEMRTKALKTLRDTVARVERLRLKK